jgi:hypothetical protein
VEFTHQGERCSFETFLRISTSAMLRPIIWQRLSEAPMHRGTIQVLDAAACSISLGLSASFQMTTRCRSAAWSSTTRCTAGAARYKPGRTIGGHQAGLTMRLRRHSHRTRKADR